MFKNIKDYYMEIHMLSIIKNLRYTKLNDLFTYYYICLEESFMELTEDTQDLKNIDTYIKELFLDNLISLDMLIKYFKSNNISVKKVSNNILLVSMQNDPAEERDLNDFKRYLDKNGYRESCFKYKDMKTQYE